MDGTLKIPNREGYFKVWEDYVKYYKGNRAGVEKFYVKSYGMSGMYDVKISNFQRIPDVVYKRKGTGSTLAVDAKRYYEYWANKVFEGRNVAVYCPKDNKFKNITYIPLKWDGHTHFIFRGGIKKSEDVTIEKDFIDRLYIRDSADGLTKNKEGVTMSTEKVCNDVEKVEKPKTALEEVKKYVGVVFDPNGAHVKTIPIKSKKEAKAYVTAKDNIGFTMVLYKRAESYKADIPITVGK